MKKIKNLGLVLVAITMVSCEKEEEAIVDCFGQSFFLNVHHSVSTENPKLVNFSVSYDGDHTLDGNIKWHFGDGTPAQMVNGTATTHTYTATGTYAAKATVWLNNGGCSYDLDESVTVE